MVERTNKNIYMYIYICVCGCGCMCVCVCVCVYVSTPVLAGREAAPRECLDALLNAYENFAVQARCLFYTTA